MIKEQKLIIGNDNEEILKILLKEGKYTKKDEDIELKYYEDKQILKDKEQENFKDDGNKSYIVGKYKDTYIGCLSNNSLNSREKFGLNKYINNYFYFGQWQENKKEGIGFLKMEENILYLGNFSNNQIHGFGILYYKKEGYIYFGTFIEGQMDKGIYYNIEKSLFYHGKFINGKKNDKLCTYFDIKNNNIFIGEVKNDIFIRGYLSLCEIIEEKIDNNRITTKFSSDKAIYFDKTEPDKPRYEYLNSFDIDFAMNLQSIFIDIFEVDFNLKDIYYNYVAFFENLENIIYNDSYTEYLDMYNPLENTNVEKSFLRNYEIYYKRFFQSQEKLNIEEYKDMINREPKMNTNIEIETN